MHIPRHFHEQDEDRLLALMTEYGFATLVTSGSGNGPPIATHVPLLAERSAEGKPRLVGHLSRSNPQWGAFASGSEVLAIFHGPHAYVSPSCYSKPGVPTWNYAVVHAYGTPTLIQEPQAVWDSLRQLSAKYEAGREAPWSPDQHEEIVSRLMAGIVAFEISITRLEGNFKLSQNRTDQDHANVMRFVEEGQQHGSQGLAEMMKAARAPTP